MVQKHYRRKEVERLTGLSRTTIYDMMSKGQFPRPVKITSKAVAWPENALADWLAERPTT